ncbi:MAG: uracil-DNA glycosylase [Thermodesulfovibrionales bacterium]|nr:uracil-DNA glycosylase [Thermodesulfovibrionales bacterium]
MREEVKKDLLFALEFYKTLGVDSIFIRRDYINFSGNEDLQSSSTIKRRRLTLENKKKALMLLREEIGDCQRCKLSKGRKNIVFGEGNVNTEIMFIGEAPGRDEDIQGRPFVGQAGQILTNLINKMGSEKGFNFKREDVYIANIVKCRPPSNRDPEPDEICSCIGFLNKQIEIIAPKIIFALGRISTHTLMGLKTPISKFSITDVRGKFFDYRTNDLIIPVMPTFHPAYFLRNSKDKILTWNDALAVLDKLRRLQ